MEVKRAYKFRFYPTPQQAEVLAGRSAARVFAYNHMLRQRTDASFQRREKVNYNPDFRDAHGLEESANMSG